MEINPGRPSNLGRAFFLRTYMNTLKGFHKNEILGR
jgi:hypothetical protein